MSKNIRKFCNRIFTILHQILNGKQMSECMRMYFTKLNPSAFTSNHL